MIEEDGRERVEEEALGAHRVSWHGDAGDVAQGPEVAQRQVAGHAHDGGGEVVRGPVDAIEKGGELELADDDGEAGLRELGLEHLLQNVVARADGEEFEG